MKTTQLSLWDEPPAKQKKPKQQELQKDDTVLDKTYFGMKTEAEKIEWHYHAIHGIYPHGTYEQVVQACQEVVAKHSEPAQSTLGKIFLSCTSYADEFWGILERILP